MYLEILQREVSLDRLETFRKVVEAGSIAEAADRNSNRQSLFSRQIKELERAFEVRLFDHHGKQRVLNEKGRELAVMVQQFFLALEDFRQGATETGSVIRIGAGESVFEGLILPHAAELHLANRDVRFEMQNMSSRSVLEGLAAGRIEIGFAHTTDFHPDLITRPVADLSYVAVIPRSLLREGQQPEFGLFGNVDCVLLAGQGRFRAGLEALASEHDFRFHATVEATSFRQLVQIIKTRSFASVVPHWYADEFEQSEFVVRTFNPLLVLSTQIHIMYHRKAADLRPLIHRTVERVSRIVSQL